LIVEQFVAHALDVASRAYVLEKGEVAHSGDAAALAKDDSFVKGSYLGDSAIEPNGNGDGEPHPDGDGERPQLAEVLKAIEGQAAQEGRNSTEVLLDLLRQAIDGKGGMS
jgi:hypothetical protein